MKIDQEALITEGKRILYNNKKGDYTLPTEMLYPFQWNWDSGFVSIGFSKFDMSAALSEIRSLVSGQWKNGMIPHIIFHSEIEKSYFPNWDFWNAELNPGATAKPKTSGITQPPVLGFALEWILKEQPKNQEVIAFVKEMFPKIVAYHQFWYTYRDPHKEGLVFIFHPWESGRDNSPLWDEALNRIDLEQANLPSYQRRDIKIADASERPTSKQYDQYVSLIQLGKKHQYDGPGIVEESEYLMQDSLINAMLIRSNEGLIYVGEQMGFDVGKIKEWQQQSMAAYNEKLWNPKINFYTTYDLRAKKQLVYREIGGLTPLFAGLPNQERADKLNHYLTDLSDKQYLLAPSWDVEHKWYDSKRYWRGPIWPQMNWLLYHGSKRYGYHDTALQLKNDFLELVSRFGFHEYFEAQRHLLDQVHGGYGGKNFSWTASSVIHLLLDE
jgi:hypothetical protein